MADIFSEAARTENFERARAVYRRVWDEHVGDIDADIANRGFGQLSSHDELLELFRAVRVPVEVMQEFDSRHAELAKQTVAAGKTWTEINPFCESHEAQLSEWVKSELAEIPARIMATSTRLLLPPGSTWDRLRDHVTDTTIYGIHRFYGEQRAMFGATITPKMSHAPDVVPTVVKVALSGEDAKRRQFMAKEPKRSTQRGEGKAKLIAALTKHHQYADDGCLNQEPIGNNELARQAGVADSTATEFFKSEFRGRLQYRACCMDAGSLVDAIKTLRGEFTPAELAQRFQETIAAVRREVDE